MEKWLHITKTLTAILFGFCIYTSGAFAAVSNPKLDIQGGPGSVSNDGTNLSIDALVIAIITDGGVIDIIPDVDFSLDAIVSGVGAGGGSLTAGNIANPLLTATFTNFSLAPAGGLFTSFSADLTYTGGSMKGALAGGSIDGTYTEGMLNVSAKIGPVVVPVPAAVWLLGSGLIGLVSVARRTRS